VALSSRRVRDLLVQEFEQVMDSKFAKFLKENQIDERRVVAASRQIERLRPEDRRVRLRRKQRKQSEAAGAPAPEGAKEKPQKPRSGRVVTERLLKDASAGKPVSGAAKTRLLRALNRVLEQKKKQQTDFLALF
jgi:hypothetical protein